MMNNKKICNDEMMNNPVGSKEKLSGRVTINDLSDECLAKVFSYLNYGDRLNIEDVCTRWEHVGSELSWNNVKVFKDSLTEEDRPVDLQKLFQRCGRFLTEFSSGHFYMTSVTRLIGENCPNLIKLQMKFCNWNLDDFVGAFDKMKSLKIVYIDTFGLGRVDGYALLKNLPKTVEKFFTEFVDFNSLNDQDLEPLFEKLGVLQELTLDTAKLDNQIMEWMMKKKSLVHLDLETSSLTGVVPPTEVDLPNLEYLQLSGLDYLHDDLIINFIKNCKKLKYFNIGDSPQLAKKSLRYLGDLKNLEELYLSDQSDALTDLVVENIKNLKVFECANCKRITDRSIMKIITNSWRLEKLDVFGTRVTAATLEHADSVCKSRKQKLCMTIGERIMLDREIENDYLTIEIDDDGCDVAEPSDDDSD